MKTSQPADDPAHADPPSPPAASPPAASPPAAAPGRTPRAGRDLPKAIGVGLTVGALAIALLIVFRPGFVALIAIVMAMAVWELHGTFRRARGIDIVWLPLATGVVATVVTTWWWGHTAQAIGIAGTALAVILYRLGRGAEGYLADVTASVFLAVYLGGFASFATLLAWPDDGLGRGLVFLICVACSDTGGYAVGALIGRHPMAPRISPKKSWEGLAGSVVIAAVGGAVSIALLLDAHWWLGALMGVVVALVATGGDLVESLIKRDLGVKDMGSLVPGHGGVMDRLDSLLPCALVSWLLLTVAVPL